MASVRDLIPVLYFSAYHVELGAGLTFAISIGPHLCRKTSPSLFIHTYTLREAVLIVQVPE